MLPRRKSLASRKKATPRAQDLASSSGRRPKPVRRVRFAEGTDIGDDDNEDDDRVPELQQGPTRHSGWMPDSDLRIGLPADADALGVADATHEARQTSRSREELSPSLPTGSGGRAQIHYGKLEDWVLEEPKTINVGNSASILPQAPGDATVHTASRYSGVRMDHWPPPTEFCCENCQDTVFRSPWLAVMAIMPLGSSSDTIFYALPKRFCSPGCVVANYRKSGMILTVPQAEAIVANTRTILHRMGLMNAIDYLPMAFDLGVRDKHGGPVTLAMFRMANGFFLPTPWELDHDRERCQKIMRAHLPMLQQIVVARDMPGEFAARESTIIGRDGDWRVQNLATYCQETQMQQPAAASAASSGTRLDESLRESSFYGLDKVDDTSEDLSELATLSGPVTVEPSDSRGELALSQSDLDEVAMVSVRAVTPRGPACDSHKSAGGVMRRRSGPTSMGFVGHSLGTGGAAKTNRIKALPDDPVRKSGALSVVGNLTKGVASGESDTQTPWSEARITPSVAERNFEPGLSSGAEGGSGLTEMSYDVACRWLVSKLPRLLGESIQSCGLMTELCFDYSKVEGAIDATKALYATRTPTKAHRAACEESLRDLSGALTAVRARADFAGHAAADTEVAAASAASSSSSTRPTVDLWARYQTMFSEDSEAGQIARRMVPQKDGRVVITVGSEGDDTTSSFDVPTTLQIDTHTDNSKSTRGTSGVMLYLCYDDGSIVTTAHMNSLLPPGADGEAPGPIHYGTCDIKRVSYLDETLTVLHHILRAYCMGRLPWVRHIRVSNPGASNVLKSPAWKYDLVAGQTATRRPLVQPWVWRDLMECLRVTGVRAGDDGSRSASSSSQLQRPKAGTGNVAGQVLPSCLVWIGVVACSGLGSRVARTSEDSDEAYLQKIGTTLRQAMAYAETKLTH